MIYSKPKVGKTTIISKLDNCLIFDLENGTDFIDALAVKINSLADIHKYGAAILAEGKPYKYIAIDTSSKLEDMCLSLALKLYKETPMGVNFTGDNVLTLPKGSGYLYLRIAFEKVIDYLKTLSDRLILIGHIKDASIEIKGKEVNATDLDLTGKIRQITCSDADAIGYMHRDGLNTMLTFSTTDLITCGTRPTHLRGKDIIIAKSNEEGEIVETFWDKVFID